jgi:hypothetical protein
MVIELLNSVECFLRPSTPFCHESPWVLKSSLQWGDQCNEVIAVCMGIVCIGEVDLSIVSNVFQMRTLPSGERVPVAKSSGFHGHHASAWSRQ